MSGNFDLKIWLVWGINGFGMAVVLVLGAYKYVLCWVSTEVASDIMVSIDM